MAGPQYNDGIEPMQRGGLGCLKAGGGRYWTLLSGSEPYPPPSGSAAKRGATKMILDDEISVRPQEITRLTECRLPWLIVFEPFSLNPQMAVCGCVHSSLQQPMALIYSGGYAGYRLPPGYYL